MKRTKINQKKTILRRVSHVAKMVFVPHAKNCYNPHVVRWTGLVFIFLLVVFLQFGYGFAKKEQVLGTNFNITTEELLTRTNWERERVGADDLVLNQKLTKAAEMKANDMFENQYWAHISPSGKTPWEWYYLVDYDYSQAGENLAKNFDSAETVVAAWMNSEEHRENMLKIGYKDVGFAVQDGLINGDYTIVIVAMYGLTVNDAANQSFGVKTFTSADNLGIMNALSHLALLIKSMSPVTCASLMIIGIAFVTALMVHWKRESVPKTIKKSWKKHHGAFKAIGVFIFGVLVLLAGFGGSI